MKTRWGIAIGVVCGLLAAAVLFIVTSPPRGEPIQLLPAPTALPLVIHVSGAVVNPGIYTLEDNSRVQDALDAAGGLLSDANPHSMNLAAYIRDGERIWVPYQASTDHQPEPNEPANPADENDQSKQTPYSGLININTASQAELEGLPGIGPVTAGKIISHRQTYGPFTGIEDILKVSGIGPATFETIQSLITVESGP
ncbi:MAG: helix-hairpin-helix domain-containing protein [Anaerolineales bacterium]